jgi:hypothetical protein
MIYSPTKRVALARYPKTATTSLTEWFEIAFPDAVSAHAMNPHVPVTEALHRLGLGRDHQPSGWREVLRHPFARRPAMPRVVIGVIREPAAMLTSLYTYWRRRASVKPRRPGTLPHTAATDSFHAFVTQAVVNRKFPNYFEFFGVGGEAWPVTRLIDFQCLDSGFRAVCSEFGIEPPASLPSENKAPQTAEEKAIHTTIRAQLPGLLPAIRQRYRWYYEEAESIMVRGDAPPASRRAA